MNKARGQRRTAILEATLRCFSENGCFRTTVDRVTADVGVGKGTLFRQFGSRERLLHAAARAGVDALAAQCLARWNEHVSDPLRGCQAVIEALVELNHANAPNSPASLARLHCCCHWSTFPLTDADPATALVPLVKEWQATGLFSQGADPCCIASVTVAVVNSPFVVEHCVGATRTIGGEPGAHPVVELLRRAFSGTGSSATT